MTSQLKESTCHIVFKLCAFEYDCLLIYFNQNYSVTFAQQINLFYHNSTQFYNQRIQHHKPKINKCYFINYKQPIFIDIYFFDRLQQINQQMIKQYDQLIKLILIGSSGVGKSSVLMQFAQNKFSENYLTTIGVDFRFKTIKHEGKSIKFQIWDTAGQQRFRTITSAYYKGADGIIMVYDLTQPSSLQDIQNFWIPEAYNYCDKNTKVLLLANKCDCDKKVNSEKSKALVQQYGFKFSEVSAKTNQKIFESIRDFGLSVAKQKADKLTPNTNSNTNTQRQTTKSQSQPTESSSVHISKQRQSTQNLNYKKKCC